MNFKTTLSALMFFTHVCGPVHPADSPRLPGALQPILVTLKKPTIQARFEATGDAALNQIVWDRRKGGWFNVRGATYALKDGMLQLRPPTVESVKKTGKGNAGWVRATIEKSKIPESKMYAMGFRFRLPKIEGRRSPRFFFESGHHKVVVGGDATRSHINAFGQTQQSTQHGFEAGQWHRVLFEILGDETVVRFEGGATFYAKHPKIKDPAERPEIKFGVISTGGIDIDDFGLWEVDAKPKVGWAGFKKTYKPMPPMKK